VLNGFFAVAELEEERTRILTDPGDAMKAYSDYDSMIHFRGITDKVELHMRVTIQECQRLAQLVRNCHACRCN
jgi:hypothetical protein